MLIHGALYQLDGVAYEMLGLKSKTIVLRGLVSGIAVELPHTVAAKLIDMNVHDHAHFCCTVHNLHSSPHSGCLLR